MLTAFVNIFLNLGTLARLIIITMWVKSKLLFTHKQPHTLYPSWRPLHFLLVPIMQELYFLVLRLVRKEPQSGHTVLTSTHPPFPLSSYSLSFSFFSLLLCFSYVIDFLHTALPFCLFLPPMQAHTNSYSLAGEGTHTNKHAMFSRWRQDVPQIEGYFHMSLTWFEE